MLEAIAALYPDADLVTPWLNAPQRFPAGDGPESVRLAALGREASVPVVIVDDPSNAILNAHYRRAVVFVFPPLEDFGIMPVEAMALGMPVVANSVGGSAETVSEGVSGTHFEALVKEDVGRDHARTRSRGCRAMERQVLA